ncbi:MAG TPA: fused MFS/spermidine synthase [Burkholderiales bacterium]|nr:fused MFS/spermidine synthase [Burkholderiales bacterium]
MIYAVTIFLSSFLLFLVQPLIARLILPWFGGGAAVWTTCMLFFQLLLLAGYAYAHALAKQRRLEPIIHTALLALAVATLPIMPGESWKPEGGAEPVSRILLVLGATVGLPYFLLASTSPLIQAWFARARPGHNPYRLFALSNLASLIALLGYPFLAEPFFTSREQVLAWSWLFGAFALLCAVLAWRTPRAVPVEERQPTEPLARRDYAWWLALSATGSMLLLAVTNHLTQNVASVPLLWLAPLTLYLLTFIIAFDGKAWYRPRYLWPLVLVALIAMTWLLVDSNYHYHLALQLGVFLAGLFVACLYCHGELYRARPAASHLTAFYLTVSAGGAVGGLLVAVIAPLVFKGYDELGVGLALLALLAALRLRDVGRVAYGLALLVLLGVAGCAAYDSFRHHKDVRVANRSFYGVLRVKEYGTGKFGDASHLRRLVHGTIMHGEQYMSPERRRKPSTYYTETSGIGLAIHSKQDGPVKVGVIGLGTGTIAAYGRPGDVYRFYDINPHVVEIALREFTYLKDSPARVELALGDARLVLEREPPEGFDVLAVDAFSSDAIPVHLITREGLAVYLRHLKPDGIVAFHVSNRFLDLIPVVARLAEEAGAHAVLINDDEDETEDNPDKDLKSKSDWVLVSRDPKALAAPEIAEAATPAEDRPEWRTWTDDYSNLVQILK